MSDLRVEIEHAYGGGNNYHIVETDADGDEETVAVVYNRPDIAFGIVRALNVLEKM